MMMLREWLNKSRAPQHIKTRIFNEYRNAFSRQPEKAPGYYDNLSKIKTCDCDAWRNALRQLVNGGYVN